jgi:hypothetical protein
LTLASLLSGTPRRQQAAGAKGGLLRQVSNPGLLCLKDFTSTLTMRPENKAEVLSALREIYDGKWTRYIGTDGGKTLHWEGKLGLVFGCTGAIDTQHSVGDALGNRFLLLRLGTERTNSHGRLNIGVPPSAPCDGNLSPALSNYSMPRDRTRDHSIKTAANSDGSIDW